MTDVKVKDSDIRKAAEEGMDSFVQVFIDAISSAIGNSLTLETMQQLTADQITLLAWSYLHQEVMEGGYIQLIYNGYGTFIFRNPFAVAMRNWGLRELYVHIRHAKKYYEKYHEAIEAVVSDSDFMALYEQMPEFDDFDDAFIVNEEQWTAMIAAYIDDHIENEQGTTREKEEIACTDKEQESLVRVFLCRYFYGGYCPYRYRDKVDPCREGFAGRFFLLYQQRRNVGAGNEHFSLFLRVVRQS